MSEGATLRDQQAEFTKQLLFESIRKVIVATDSEDFTIQKIADEAGVSYRTVYRYFPNRQVLIDEFSDWIELRFNDSDAEETSGLDKVGPQLRKLFERFDRYSDYYEACARLSNGTFRPKSQAQRTAAMRVEFDNEFSDLDPEGADKAFIVLRYLVSLQTWFTLRDRFDMKNGETGDAVSWAVEVLLQALRDGNVPRSSGTAKGGDGQAEIGDE